MTDQMRPDPDPGADTTISQTPPAAAPAPMAPAVMVTSGGEPVHEPAEAVATSSVSATATGPKPRRSRLRWIAALAIVALVVTASAAAAFMLTGSSANATVLGYVPADSVAYGELRLDLPGDQEQAVGAFLSKFPGFADQAALGSKLDEALDQLVASASKDKQTFTKDIKPWFDGEMAFAIGPLPSAITKDSPESAVAKGRGLLLLSIKDPTLAAAWFDQAMTTAGASGTTETYAGVELTVFSDPAMAGAKAAFGIVDGKVALAGDIASVKAAIDTKGDGGLAKDPSFAAASDAMGGAYVGFMYVDLQAIVQSGLKLAESAGASPAADSQMLALVPDWAAFRLRVEDDALVMDAAAPHDAARPGPDKNSANKVADWAPPTTVALSAANDYGATLLETIDLLRKDASLKDAFAGIDQAAGVLGGVDAAIGWMGDTGVVVSHDGDAVEGGIISIPTDQAKAGQLLTTLRSFATLGGGQAGITVKDEDYQGTTITIIDLGSARDLIGMAGALSGQTLPTSPSTMPLPEGSIQIAYAVTDGVVVIGSGPDFVKSVLDAGKGTSLADDARYKDLVGRVGAEHTAIGFVDIAAIRTLLEGHLDQATAAEKADYEESIKPFLEPLDAAVAASTVGGDVDTQQVVVTVK